MTSYNPFKMRGSWVGLGIGLTFAILIFIVLAGLSSGWGGGGSNLIFILPLSLFPIFGFLIGYGIHALVRFIKNK